MKYPSNGIYEAKALLKTLITAACMGTLLLFGLSCSKKTEPIVPTVNSIQEGTVIHLPAMQWHIVSRERLIDVYQRAGHPIPEGAELHGITGVTPEGQTIVVTLAPQNVDDEVTLTLGHEVMHVALGDYHQPYQ